MFDTVNFWIDRAELSGGAPFDVLPYLSEISERQSEKLGYSCTGKAGDYTATVFERGISLHGSLAKYFLPSNIYTLTRRDVQQAVERLSDHLHANVKVARVTRLDVSTVLQTKRPPASYYGYLGQKPYFTRLQSTPDTLYYNNHQRQAIFYDKSKEAAAKDVAVPEILQGCNLLRYELRYTGRLAKQLNGVLTAEKLYSVAFYRSVIQRWYSEFRAIQKIKSTSVMTDGISTPKEAQTALFAALLQEKGQSAIDDFLSELRAKNVFKERQRYYELRKSLNSILTAPKGEPSDFIKELETQIFDIARYAR